MKKLIIIYAVLLLTSGFSYAQILKLQAGTSLSKLDWTVNNMNVAPYNKTMVGYSLFAGMDYLDKKFFNLSSNLGFLRKGGQSKTTLTNADGVAVETITEKAKLDYISINTMIDLKYPITDKIIPFVSVGPRFDYLLSHSSQFDGLKSMNELNSTSIGLNLGGGLKYNLSKIQIGLRADYYLNFSKIADWPAQTGNLGGQIKDRTMLINLTIGYKLK